VKLVNELEPVSASPASRWQPSRTSRLLAGALLALLAELDERLKSVWGNFIFS